jgi:hypothetical protein
MLSDKFLKIDEKLLYKKKDLNNLKITGIKLYDN